MVWSNDQANSLTFPPGATSGQRMTIDGNGILVYDTAGDLVFAVTPGNNPPAHTGQALIFGTSSGGRGIESIELAAGNPTMFAGPNATGAYSIAATAATRTDLSLPQTGAIFIAPNVLTYSRFTIGGGFQGAYYYEQTALVSGAAVANNAITDLAVIVPSGFIRNDYNPGVSQIDATGLFWTCPDTGIYEITGQCAFAGATAAAGRVQYGFAHSAGGVSPIMQDERPVTGALNSVAINSPFKGVLNTGDIVRQYVFNNTGANTIGGTNRIITFQRVL